MARSIRFFLMLFLCICACRCSLTAPDEDQFSALEHHVGVLPLSAKETIKYLSFRRAIEDTNEYEPDFEVGYTLCDDSSKNKPVLVRAILALMNSYEARLGGRPKSVDDMMQGFQDALGVHGCRFIPAVDSEVDWGKKPTSTLNRDLTKLVISLTALELSRHSSLASALGLVLTAGGWYAVAGVAIGMTLCPLSASIGCPDDPGAPNAPQPGLTPAPGGDR